MTKSSYRIAPRSAVAVADVRLLRVARTDAAPEAPSGLSFVDRLRARFTHLAPATR